jgi:hypothetical protein
VRFETQISRQPLHRAVECVLANDVQVHVEAARDHEGDGVEQERIVLHLVDAGDAQQAPGRTLNRLDRRKDRAVHTDRNDLRRRGAQAVRHHPRHEVRRHGDAGGRTDRGGQGRAIEPATLEAVADVVDGRQLAAVERDHDRNA